MGSQTARVICGLTPQGIAGAGEMLRQSLDGQRKGRRCTTVVVAPERTRTVRLSARTKDSGRARWTKSLCVLRLCEWPAIQSVLASISQCLLGVVHFMR
jgi:hypothetical protein